MPFTLKNSGMARSICNCGSPFTFIAKNKSCHSNPWQLWQQTPLTVIFVTNIQVCNMLVSSQVITVPIQRTPQLLWEINRYQWIVRAKWSVQVTGRLWRPCLSSSSLQSSSRAQVRFSSWRSPRIFYACFTSARNLHLKLGVAVYRSVNLTC